ncbi:MAG: hypothetical protein ABR923_13430 [Terracidiphilus sp.]|jgi:hypothetical protein
MNDKGRLTYLARNYYALQGVRFAPLWIAGLLLVFIWMPHFEECNCIGWGALYTAIAVTAILEAVWFWMASVYYRRRFGWLEPAKLRLATPGSGNLFWWVSILGLLAWAVYCRVNHSAAFFPYFVAFVMAQPVFDGENPPARRIEYGIGGVLIAASAPFSILIQNNGTIYFATLCVCMLALSIADHLLLLTLMKPVGTDD